MHALVLVAWSLVVVTPVQSTPQVAPPTEGIEAVGSVQDPSALTSARALPRQRTASWLALPFLVLLLMIATGPVFYPGHWHRRYVVYALALGAIVVLYYVFALGRPGAMVHALEEYLSFLALVGALYVASGGIHVQVNAPGTPLTNVILLAVGAVLANLIATTGAAILLIRPYLSLNRGRIRPYHVVFFIIIVGNVGGALLPLGDPPLFLGF
ncbi:MAG: sodium:proton antiporter, partial [Rhodothermales bacterium]